MASRSWRRAKNFKLNLILSSNNQTVKHIVMVGKISQNNECICMRRVTEVQSEKTSKTIYSTWYPSYPLLRYYATLPMILNDVRNWLQSTLGTCSVFVCPEYSPLSGTQEPATPRCSSNTRVLSWSSVGITYRRSRWVPGATRSPCEHRSGAGGRLRPSVVNRRLGMGVEV